MRTSILFFVLALLSFCCKGKIDQNCDLVIHPFNPKSEELTINLPPYKVLDSIVFIGLDRTIVYNYQVESINKEDTSTLFITANNYNYPETRHFLDFGNVKTKVKNETEYPLKEKNIITDTVIKIDTFKVGFLKYLVDPKKTDYVQKSGPIHYDSKIFFLKQDHFIEIEIIEKYKDKKYNKQSLANCILQNLKFKR